MTSVTRAVAQITQGSGTSMRDDVDVLDVYDVAGTDLGQWRGLIVSGGCDQVALERCEPRLSEWVRRGGRLLVNGHPLRRFVAKLPLTRRLEFHGMNDVWLSALGDHPIWAGIARDDLVLRTGVPGHHCLEELKQIGVAGFYAHVYLAECPDNVRPITGIGEHRMPVDVSYRLGDGEVIVHAGNDLAGFNYPDRSTADLQDAIVSYLSGGNA